jgi:hypothetical protein
LKFANPVSPQIHNNGVRRNDDGPPKTIVSAAALNPRL